MRILQQNEVTEQKSGVRFSRNTSAYETVQSRNFYNAAFVVNSLEIPYETFVSTRGRDWYSINPYYYNKMPERATRGADMVAFGLIAEDDLIHVCKWMYRFARYVGYGARTHNADINSRSYPQGGQTHLYMSVSST